MEYYPSLHQRMFKLSVLSIIASCFMHQQCMVDYLMQSIVIGVIKRVKVNDRWFIKQFQGDKYDSELSVKYYTKGMKGYSEEKLVRTEWFQQIFRALSFRFYKMHVALFAARESWKEPLTLLLRSLPSRHAKGINIGRYCPARILPSVHST